MAGKRLGQGDLESTNPNLAMQWDFEKNETNPEHHSKTERTKVWWICELGHSWSAEIAARNSGRGCPICAGKRIQNGYNDLKTLFPTLAKQMIDENLKPEELGVGSSKQPLWQCEKAHPYRATVAERVRRWRQGSFNNCPVCRGKTILPGISDLSTKHPELLAEWDFDRNRSGPAANLAPSSKKKFWWVCRLGHNFEQTVAARTNLFQGCPFCAGKKTLEGFNDLRTLYPKIAASWHSEKNGIQRPEDFVVHSAKMIWWLCDLGHEWEARIYKRVDGRNCPYCANKKLLRGFNDLATKYPRIALQLSPANALNPSEIMAGSSKKLEWVCDFGHTWLAAPIHRQRTGCPTCTSRIVQRGFNDLATTRPDLLAEWDFERNKDISPYEITQNSAKQAVWWKCESGHSWTAKPNARWRSGCARCSAKGGFDGTSAGTFYFLQHDDLQARKIGVTGLGSDRLRRFKEEGWEIVAVWSHTSGNLIRDLETVLLRWIRLEQELPPYLLKAQMLSTGGWSETFSIEGPTNGIVISEINVQYQVLRKKFEKYGYKQVNGDSLVS